MAFRNLKAAPVTPPTRKVFHLDKNNLQAINNVPCRLYINNDGEIDHIETAEDEGGAPEQLKLPGFEEQLIRKLEPIIEQMLLRV